MRGKIAWPQTTAHDFENLPIKKILMVQTIWFSNQWKTPQVVWSGEPDRPKKSRMLACPSIKEQKKESINELK